MILKKNNKTSVSVIGDGSWATALVKIISENDTKTHWWVRNKDRVKYIKSFGNNPHYLSSVQFVKRRVKPNTRLNRVVDASKYIILAVPAAFIKDVLDQLPENAFDDKIIISAVKGMIPSENCLVTDYVQKRFNVSENRIAVICGPCHAEEVAMERQAYLTSASKSIKLAEEVADLFRGRYVKVTCLQDVVGVEYAAVMKNIIALAVGVSYGLGYGDNLLAVLISNSIKEISTFLSKLYPADRDVLASAYLGDLLVTSYSQFSRNRTFGTLIGRGYTVKSAMVEMKMVAEGYYATDSIHKVLGKNNLELPIINAVHNVLYGNISPHIEFQLLKQTLK